MLVEWVVWLALGCEGCGQVGEPGLEGLEVGEDLFEWGSGMFCGVGIEDRNGFLEVLGVGRESSQGLEVKLKGALLP